MSKVAVKCGPKESINWSKTSSDLQFIKSFQVFTKSQNWRIVVYGGYGLDILLGSITRTHNDVDLVIYGQTSRQDALHNIKDFLANLVNNSSVKISENDFMLEIDLKSPGLGANIYYVQINGDPYQSLNVVVKKSGESITNSIKRFPSPLEGVLDDIHIEVQNPHSHLADILDKQRTLVNRQSHIQDIANLRQITDADRVDEILSLS
jgi:hypothetical protein